MVKKIKVKVYHSYYGCDTGCCGHVVELEDGRERFEFDHPDAGKVREFVEAVIKSEWPECLESIDWNNMEVELNDY